MCFPIWAVEDYFSSKQWYKSSVFYFSQLQDGKNLGISGTLKNIWKTEGFAGMFKGEILFNQLLLIKVGNGTNIIRIFPYSAVQFASYGFAKKVPFFNN